MSIRTRIRVARWDPTWVPAQCQLLPETHWQASAFDECWESLNRSPPTIYRRLEPVGLIQQLRLFGISPKRYIIADVLASPLVLGQRLIAIQVTAGVRAEENLHRFCINETLTLWPQYPDRLVSVWSPSEYGPPCGVRGAWRVRR